MKRKIQRLAEQVGINKEIAVALSNTLSEFFRKRTSQHESTEKQPPQRTWRWVLLLVGGLLVGGILVFALLVWVLSNIPFIGW